VEVLAELPAGAHDPVIYPVAAIRGHVSEEVKQLLRFFRSPEAAAVFARHGFTSLIEKKKGEDGEP